MVSVVELSLTNWEEEISKSSMLAVVYFWHEQCPWCMRFTPIFEQTAEEYLGKIKFAKLNIFASPVNQKIAANLGVMSTPTLMFLCNGRPVGQSIGSMSDENLKRALDEMLRRYKACIRQSTDLRSYIA